MTGSYRNLQGFKGVPLGVWFLFVAVGEYVATSSGQLPPWASTSYLVGLVAAFMLYWIIGRYYERAFGHVVQYGPAYGDRRRSWTETAASVLLAFLGFSAAFSGSSSSFAAGMLGLGLAAALLAFWWPRRRLRKHYAVMAVIVAGISLLLLPGIVPVDQAAKSVFLTEVGVVLIFAGVFDHRVLVGTMRPVPEEDDDAVG